MTELNWNGKEKAKQLPGKARELAEVRSQKTGAEDGVPHEIYEGDNLDVMLAKRKQWHGRFTVIYIDPPYNTGNADFYYKDRFRKGDAPDNHTDWLNFIYPRLLLAKEFLSEDGAIFISLDDAELYHLKLVCDEIFGERNFVANFVRKNKSGAGHDSRQVAIEYDYVLCYAKSPDQLILSKDSANAEKDPKYRYQDKYVKKRGKYYLRDLDYRGNYSPTLDYPLAVPDGSEIWPGKKKGRPNTWRWSKNKVEWGKENDFIVFKNNGQGWKAYIKQYQFVDNRDKRRTRKIPFRSLIEFSNSKGSQELKNILDQSIFSYPKPVGLIRYFLRLFGHRKDIAVLDFFAGSGTTLHAVMEQNAADNGSRTCVLVNNNENNICKEVTYARNKKVIEGYKTPRGKAVEGLSGNLVRYFKVK